MLNTRDGKSMLFMPSFLKINPGDRVTFIPTSKGHNSQSVFVPKNADKWKSNASEKITITLKEEGIYIYECMNHFIMGMNGVIQVGEAKNLRDAKEFAKKYRKKTAMNKDRLDKALEKSN